jgi:hypothetical protein
MANGKFGLNLNSVLFVPNPLTANNHFFHAVVSVNLNPDFRFIVVPLQNGGFDKLSHRLPPLPEFVEGNIGSNIKIKLKWNYYKTFPITPNR